MKKYIIRYNIDHKKGLSDKKWRVYSEDGSELFLVNSIKLHVVSSTEDTKVGDETKYSIVSIGTLVTHGDEVHIL